MFFTGLAKDDKTLRELGVTNGSKMMLIGSKLKDVISIDSVTPSTSTAEESSSTKKEPLSQQKMHLKVCFTVFTLHIVIVNIQLLKL